MIIIIDILPFAITEFSRIFIESMNKEEITFKSQYILQSLAKIDPGFTYTITHYSDKNVTGIVWMTSYMHDNFEKFGNDISIDVIKSQVCNAKKFCYIAPIVLNEVGKAMLFTKVSYYLQHMMPIVLYQIQCSKCVLEEKN